MGKATRVSEAAVACVLLVGGDPDLKQTVVSILAPCGYEVVHVEGKDAAQSAVEGRHIDAVLLVLSGSRQVDSDLISRLRDLLPNVAIIVTSGGGDISEAVSALCRGTDHHLERPLDPKPLQEMIAPALEPHLCRAELSEEQLRYERLINEAPLAVFELRDGRFIYVSRYLLLLSGYQEEEMVGHRLEEFVVPEGRGKLSEYRGRGKEQHLLPGFQRCGFRRKDGSLVEVRIDLRLTQTPEGLFAQGTLCNLSEETRLLRLHQVMLEIGEALLAEQDIDRILQLVLDAIARHSGFQRAVLTLYDLSAPNPFEGDSFKRLASGVSSEEIARLEALGGLTPAERRFAFDDRFRINSAYYAPHDQVPWDSLKAPEGAVTVKGWHKDDYLFIPLRAERGIIGHISVGDPVDQRFLSVEFLQPVVSLTNLAALAVERTHKFHHLCRQKERLHGLSAFGRQLSEATNIDVLCRMAVERLFHDMNHDYCTIWLREGTKLVLHGVAAKEVFPVAEVPREGTSIPLAKREIARQVLRSAKTVLIPNMSDRENMGNEVHPMINAGLYVPIVGREGTLGLVSVESLRTNAFSEEDQQVLEAIATEIAVAILNLALQEDLRQQAIHDPLTGLYNRHYFNEMIRSELGRADRYQHPLSLMMVDVDGFRAVNNRLGHLRGDKVLSVVAQRLKEKVRSVDRVIRYGGDEFVILMPETDGVLGQVAQRLKEKILQIPHELDLDGLTVGLSIGIYTRYPHDPRSLEQILEEADRRMYADKRVAHGGKADEYCY